MRNFEFIPDGNNECEVCGICSFRHLHQPNTKPKDFVRIYEEQANRDYWTIEAMQKYGGSFVSNLGRAAAHADSINLAKIKDAFPDEWNEMEKFGQIMEEEAK